GLGNATGSKDVGGVISYKVYDGVGRVLYEMDALRYVTGYVYDAFGGATTVTHYFNTKSVSGTPTSLTASQIKPTASGANDRALTMTYDNAGRLLTVTQPSVFMFDPDGTTQSYSTTSITTNAYNAFGQLITATQDRKYVSGTDPTNYSYYDKAGRLAWTV